jgi:hypothetical protein
VEFDPTANQVLPRLSGALQADAHASAPPTPSPRRIPKLYVILRARNSMSVCWHAARNESRATWPGQPGGRPPVRKPQGFGYVWVEKSLTGGLLLDARATDSKSVQQSTQVRARDRGNGGEPKAQSDHPG